MQHVQNCKKQVQFFKKYPSSRCLLKNDFFLLQNFSKWPYFHLIVFVIRNELFTRSQPLNDVEKVVVLHVTLVGVIMSENFQSWTSSLLRQANWPRHVLRLFCCWICGSLKPVDRRRNIAPSLSHHAARASLAHERTLHHRWI